jgi:hypothetical protein
MLYLNVFYLQPQYVQSMNLHEALLIMQYHAHKLYIDTSVQEKSASLSLGLLLTPYSRLPLPESTGCCGLKALQG